MASAAPVTIDIEPTNRCNAKCHFCPRDQTPHQGLMTPEVFDLTLSRAVDVRDVLLPLGVDAVQVSLCGLGEPLLNPKTPSFVRKVRDAGFSCTMSSNAAILDERRARAVLDAGLQVACLNVGDLDEEYEDIYGLPFDKTRDNVIRFRDLAGDDCTIKIVLVDHRRDAEHTARMKDYWGGFGFDDFMEYDIINRGGSLFVDHMEFEKYPERQEAEQLLSGDGCQTFCSTPFISMFVGYDGNYYLCCSDWRKEVPLGHVSDASFVSVMQAKYDHVRDRGAVCRTCNIDPVNAVTEELRAVVDGESTTENVEKMVKAIRTMSVGLSDGIDRVRAAHPDEWGTSPSGTRRRLIPVRAG